MGGDGLRGAYCESPHGALLMGGVWQYANGTVHDVRIAFRLYPDGWKPTGALLCST